ncbi:MAG TPA: hypothetical protein VMT51_14880 [Dongiaceae bacterium]|nr:hypothetical protein [Dongiaceae bacterium]
MPASRGAADRLPVHLNRLAGLWLANGALRLLEVLGFWTVSRLFDWMDFGMGGLPWAATIWGIRFSEGAMFLFGMFGVLHLVLAWGLFQRASWARYLGVALGFLALFRFPLGTALGVYTLWVLLPVASAKEYERISQTA